MNFGTFYQWRTQVFPGERARIQRGFRLATGGLLSPDLPAKGPPDQGTFRPAEEFHVRRGLPYNGGLVLGGPPVQRVSCTERASCTEGLLYRGLLYREGLMYKECLRPERAFCPGNLLSRGAAWPDGPPVKMGLMSIWAFCPERVSFFRECLLPRVLLPRERSVQTGLLSREGLLQGPPPRLRPKPPTPKFIFS